MIIGFTCSAFDLLHAGHIVMLKECRDQCDKLIVGLHTDPSIDRVEKNKPVQSTYERFTQLNGCKYVDTIIPYDTEKDLVNILSIEDINIRFLGVEYKGQKITGDQICIRRNIRLIYTTRFHSYSSTELRGRLINGNRD